MRGSSKQQQPLAMTMVKPGKKASKGRQKIKIRRIEDKAKRQVTLWKRKGGTFKKCSELQLLCGSHVAVTIFSKKEEPLAPTIGGRPSRGGNVFAMGMPSVDHVLCRFAPLPGDEVGLLLPAGAKRATMEATAREVKETEALVKAEKDRMSAVGEKVLQAAEAAGKWYWWEADVEALGEAELPEFTRALQRVREIAQREADKLRTSAPAAAPWRPQGVGQSH
ncbi:agamous-like MADS-box protein AGL62 [Panicum miliaceum]|uniref:Agamous-like MADS-box protein AGL62 n=1 Tax=Panicum miliaceum TaxID=4540 RepID=A0A3L6S1S3_PANMI|nr:agamous-like MADS-box protein AGL62 [Panicum miliaceum]